MSITDTARAFFDACEDGKGWEGCSAYCTPDATFSAQAEPLATISTLKDYTEWMKDLLTVLTDGRYELVSFATDANRNNVCAFILTLGLGPRSALATPAQLFTKARITTAGAATRAP